LEGVGRNDTDGAFAARAYGGVVFSLDATKLPAVGIQGGMSIEPKGGAQEFTVERQRAVPYIGVPGVKLFNSG